MREIELFSHSTVSAAISCFNQIKRNIIFFKNSQSTWAQLCNKGGLSGCLDSRLDNDKNINMDDVLSFLKEAELYQKI